MPIRPAEAHAIEIMAKLKVNPASPHASFHIAYCEQMRKMILEATVLPAGAPPMTAPSGGGPVVGTGKLT